MHQIPRLSSGARLAIPAAALLACTFLATPAEAGGVASVATGSFTHLHSPGSDGSLESYASGAGVSLMVIEPDDELSLGGELQATFLAGEGERRVYDLGVSFIVSYGMDDNIAVPFMRLGLDLTGATAADLDQERARGVMTGVHGGAGLHGFLTKELYWRAEVGFLGAGPGGVTSRFSIGYNFGDF